MWLTKRFGMDSHVDVSEVPSQSLPTQHIANFSYPRTDFVHLYRRDHAGARDSRGSESSPPPMVEDHGSETSAEDECQYRVTGPGLWDSWHPRDHEGKGHDHPALMKSTSATRYDAFSQEPSGALENTATGGSPSGGSQSGRPARHAVVSGSDRQPHAPKPPPKVSYSLFPPPSVPQRRPLVTLQIPSNPRQPRLEPSPLSPIFPSTPNSRTAVTDGKGDTTPLFRPNSSWATTPGSARGGSVASSSDSIPLLLRSPGPTPPHSPSGTSSSSELPGSVEAPPRYPLRLRKRIPSHSNLSQSPLFKMNTRSSPLLAKAQPQEQASEPHHNKPPTQADLCDRPLPPLPPERPPSPPHISVFETDSDDEDDSTSARPGSSDSRNLARRFMHGLVHHHYHHQHQNVRKAKGPLAKHKRSISDEGPSTSSSNKGRGYGISRTFNVARYRRAGAMEGSAEAARCAVSMELPRGRDCAGSAQSQRVTTVGEGEEKSGRLWGKFLRRRGG